MIKIFLSTTFIFPVLIAFGQSNTKTEAEIRKLEQTVLTALLNGDTNMLKELWAPEFMVSSPRNDILPNREAVLRTQRGGGIHYSSFDKVVEQIQFRKNLVITMGQETFVSINNIPGATAGQPYKRRFTNIWVKKKGKWQQVARQSSMICQ